MTSLPKPAAVLALIFALTALGMQPTAAANQLKQVMDQHGPALVTIKYVAKFGANQQQDADATGVIIDATGIVLTSNVRMGGNPTGGQAATPTDIKVLIGDDTEGLDAEVVGRDSELDLAWLKITEKITEPLPAINLGQSADPDVGDPVLGLRLMDKYYDYARAITRGYVSAKVSKPRELYLAGTQANAISEPGLPLFAPDGKIVGIVVVQIPDQDALAAAGNRRPRDVIFTLPAKRVLRQTQIALDEYEQRKIEEAEAAEALEAAGGSDAAAGDASERDSAGSGNE